MASYDIDINELSEAEKEELREQVKERPDGGEDADGRGA